MKATMKGQLTMGLIESAIKMYSGIERSEKVSFNQLHHDCHNKLNQKMFCSTCNVDIVDKTAEIVKGYPLTKEDWVILSEAEIDSCKKEASDKIRIFQFIDPGEINEIYFQSVNFLEADKDGKETFGLIYQLVVDSGKIALAKMISRGKDNFLAIKPYGGILVAYDLYFPNQIRSTDEIEKPQTNLFDKETLDLAKALVKKMTKKFDPAAIKDEYTEGLRRLIKDKSEGKAINVVEKKVERKVVSLKDALKGSLDEAVGF